MVIQIAEDQEKEDKADGDIGSDQSDSENESGEQPMFKENLKLKRQSTVDPRKLMDGEDDETDDIKNL